MLRHMTPTTPDTDTEQIIRQAARSVLPHDLTITGNRLLDDLHQVARIAIWRESERRGELSPALAYTIARRACIDLIRADTGRTTHPDGRRLRLQPLTLDLDKHGTGAAEYADALIRDHARTHTPPHTGQPSILRVDLDTAIARLKPKHALLARAWLYHELTWAEIAPLTGYASTAAANVAWCSTVRPKLRAALAGHHP